MGIRIKKILCYALTDLKTSEDRWTITDERISSKIRNDRNTFWDQVYDSKSNKNFIEWIRDNREGLCVDLRCRANGTDRTKHDFIDIGLCWLLNDLYGPPRKPIFPVVRPRIDFPTLCVYDPEYGLPNVMGFVDCLSKDWYRSDNTIDYYEASKNEAPCEPSVQEIPCGIYPHLMMIKKPGTEPMHGVDNDRFKQGMPPAQYQMMTGRWDKKQSPICGSDVAQYLLKSYRPLIPDSILFWTYFMGIFENWEVGVQDLRPILYTYWS